MFFFFSFEEKFRKKVSKKNLTFSFFFLFLSFFLSSRPSSPARAPSRTSTTTSPTRRWYGQKNFNVLGVVLFGGEGGLLEERRKKFLTIEKKCPKHKKKPNRTTASRRPASSPPRFALFRISTLGARGSFHPFLVAGFEREAGTRAVILHKKRGPWAEVFFRVLREEGFFSLSLFAFSKLFRACGAPMMMLCFSPPFSPPYPPRAENNTPTTRRRRVRRGSLHS